MLKPNLSHKFDMLMIGALLAAFQGLSVDASVLPSAKALLVDYCYDCHDAETSKGDIDLESALENPPLVRHLALWENVAERTRNGDMPPEKKPQPSEEERARILAWLESEIDDFDYSRVDNPGFVPVRRLTHVEFNNTIRDLFGLDLKLVEDFPADLSGSSGFDNSANTLFVQPALLERYVAVIDKVMALALPDTISTGKQRAVHQQIFKQLPPGKESDREAAADTLRPFLTRAFRRSPSEDELAQSLAIYERETATGRNFESAIKRALSATLMSPNFLLKIEESKDTNNSYRVNDWELASRLSYFLWASMPDEELSDLAQRNLLSNETVLRHEVARMLKDPRSDSLGSVFAAQWLGYDDLGVRIRMDPIDNPWCTDSLMDAMKAESAIFFTSLVRENLPLQRLIDADYTYLNSELASHYGMKGIEGESMQRVLLTDRNRGGIFGQGSIHAVTSFPYRTSPVVRGKWILDTVLGTPPPPPPPNVSEISDEIRKQRKLTRREKLELHRKNPNCYGCHSKMDPLGFSMENFDWFGRWREKDRGKPVDADGELPDGTKFTGTTGLKEIILERRFDDLTRQITRKMLSYALGRQLEYYDELAVRGIVDELERDEFKVQTLIQSIVTSYPFQYKKNPEPEDE